MKNAIYTISLALGVLLAGCNSSKKATTDATADTLEGTYAVQIVQEKDYRETPLAITFNTEENTFSATTECNGLFGNFTTEQNTLAFEGVAATKKYCEGKMEAEQDIAAALENTGSYKFENGVLTLYGKEEKTVLLTATKDTTHDED